MKKNNLILLIKNQMSDKQKNEDALHLNTLLLSSIENPSIDNDCLESISKFVIDLGVSCEFEKFLTEVKYIQERNYLEEKIGLTFPVFKVDKNNIISFDDSDNSYIFSITQLSTKTWIEITYDDFLSILESLEWQASVETQKKITSTIQLYL